MCRRRRFLLECEGFRYCWRYTTNTPIPIQVFGNGMDPIWFRQLTHIDFETFCLLTNWLLKFSEERKLSSRLYKWYKNRRITSTPFDCAVLCGVLYLTSSGTLRVKAFGLNIPKSTYDNLACYVVEELAARSHEVISIPPKEKQVFMLSNVIRSPFTGALFALDGTLVNLLYKGKDNSNFTRKGAAQLNVQILCDWRKNIVFLDSNYSGRSYDNIAFVDSPAWDLIHNKGVLREGGFIIADEGYALCGKVLRPYRKNTELPERKLYREIFKSARLTVENAIGLFKERCSWLNNGLHAATPAKMTITILAAGVLHQFALFCENTLNNVSNNYLNQSFDIPARFFNKTGYELRQEVTDYLVETNQELFNAIKNNTYK